MSNSSTSLAILFQPGEIRVPELTKTVATVMGRLSALQVAPGKVAPSLCMAVARHAVDLVKYIVDIPLADILVGAWKTHRRFYKYTDRKQFPPEKVSRVALATHHLKSRHEPYLELFVNDVPAGKIHFQLELDLTVEGGILLIQDGKFMRIEAARCRVTGSLKCEGQPIVERSSKYFAWSDGIPLGNGIPIAATSAAA